MFGFSGVLIPSIFENISLFQGAKVTYGEVYSNFNSDTEITLWIIIALCISLFFKNSNQIIKSFKPNIKTIVLIAFLFLIALLNLDKNVEFIYFNF